MSNKLLYPTSNYQAPTHEKISMITFRRVIASSATVIQIHQPGTRLFGVFSQVCLSLFLIFVSHSHSLFLAWKLNNKITQETNRFNLELHKVLSP